jgi:hypothetical protein
VQTFLPYPDLRLSCQVLDDRRLGKQRVETFQVLRALTWPQYAWKNHPAVRMWRGFVPALVEYGVESCREWSRRGYADSVAEQLVAWTGGEVPTGAPLPPWFGLEALHLSHRSALLRKEPEHYRPLFASLGNPDEPDDLPYLWPPDVFPRWPVRGGPDGLPVEEAALLLGLQEPHPWQADAVGALGAGRDVLLVARPGRGGSTTGLLAGLALPGRTLWVVPWEGERAGPPPAHEPPVPAPRPEAASAADRPPPIARPPSEVDLAAMRAEAAAPEFVFAHPEQLPDVDGARLLVVDRAERLTAAEASAVGDRARAARLPVLLVTGRADEAQRAQLAARYGLADPVHAGGGWDVPARLGAVVVTGATTRRRVLVELVRSGRPALVVTTARERADRLVTALGADGVRAAVWAPPPLRASRAAGAVAAWRSRRVDALVVPAGALPPLGRVGVALLVGDGAALAGAEQWHALVDAVQPRSAVLLAGPDATPGAAALAADPGCRRAALLAPFGEPVAVPCGRCDACGG